jgi:hypothetical protein
MRATFIHFELTSVAYIVIGQDIVFNLDYLFFEYFCYFAQLADFFGA